MTEFSIIENYCHGVGPNHKETVLSVGDDAAVVSVPEGMELAISVDSMVAGVHFFPDASPASIAHKLLAVNLSDMAAMGAEPKWVTMALTLPESDESWLHEFSTALKHTADEYQLQLIGGDTTQGPLNLSITIMGLLPKGNALTRRGACSGDDVYVSNVVGDAALGLHYLLGDLRLAKEHQKNLVDALERPTPRVALGQALRYIASACLDVSDGLVGDLKHICECSQVEIEIELEAVPVSKAYSKYLSDGGDMSLALNGGDDYELAFTAGVEHRNKISTVAKECSLKLTRIGKVIQKADTMSERKVSLTRAGQAYTLPRSKSFEHFS